MQLAPVAVEDLLLRPSVTIDYQRLEEFVRGKSIIVTGGGGSIGAEICDRVVTFGAARLLVVEHSEVALHTVLETLRAKGTGGRDRRPHRRCARPRAHHARVRGFQARHRVPRRRAQARAAARSATGARGSRPTCSARSTWPMPRWRPAPRAMVMISTDKAIEPVSVLGATKRFAEMYCAGARCRFCAPRRRRASGDAPDRGAFRQRARLERLGGAEVQGADRGRRAGHGHAPRHGALLHDHPRGLRPRRDARRAMRSEPSAPTCRSTCSTWASR